jgi:hypothetical protein
VGRQLGAEQAGPEYPHGHFRALAGHGQHALARLVGHIVHQFQHVLRELFRVGLQVAAQRARRRLVGTGCAAQTQVDTAGCSASSVPNCSAMTSGEWLGSMTPPAPTRMVLVPAATWAITTAVAALAMPGMPWCSASQ